jgi:putative transcriptional regulator
VYAGYAGWAPGQLRFELAHGGWRMIQARPENIFTDQPEALWQRLTDALGGIAI